MQSDTFTLTVIDLPYVERLEHEYFFPPYTGLEPRVVEDGGGLVDVGGGSVPDDNLATRRRRRAGGMVAEGPEKLEAGGVLAYAERQTERLVGLVRGGEGTGGVQDLRLAVDRVGFRPRVHEGPVRVRALVREEFGRLEERGRRLGHAKRGEERQRTSRGTVVGRGTGEDEIEPRPKIERRAMRSRRASSSSDAPASPP